MVVVILFSDSFGAFAELGYGVTYLTLGVTFKFNI
jgi:hypothetical protein